MKHSIGVFCYFFNIIFPFKQYSILLTFFFLLLNGCFLADEVYTTKHLRTNKRIKLEASSHIRTGVWLKVQSSDRTLTVMNSSREITKMRNVAFGSGGVGKKGKVGDKITPTGDFKIVWVNRKSRFKIFYGLNYPTAKYAKQGLADGRINKYEYGKIKLAEIQRKTPPQYTALGGQIGIHGLGNADLFIHERLDWTNGCIALNNQQIEELGKYIKIGTTVVVE